VKRSIFLDSGVIGLITNPNLSAEGINCAKWLLSHINQGKQVIIPEIVDYEVRRELLRANKVKGLARLDELIDSLEYLPITTESMRQAAVFWAEARQKGQPTASDKTIDADMILVAQVFVMDAQNKVIATTNVGHLSRFVAADIWQNIL
jgi:predicted nucleic acid-binding protein